MQVSEGFKVQSVLCLKITRETSESRELRGVSAVQVLRPDAGHMATISTTGRPIQGSFSGRPLHTGRHIQGSFTGRPEVYVPSYGFGHTSDGVARVRVPKNVPLSEAFFCEAFCAHPIFLCTPFQGH